MTGRQRRFGPPTARLALGRDGRLSILERTVDSPHIAHDRSAGVA